MGILSIDFTRSDVQGAIKRSNVSEHCIPVGGKSEAMSNSSTQRIDKGAGAPRPQAPEFPALTPPFKIAEVRPFVVPRDLDLVSGVRALALQTGLGLDQLAIALPGFGGQVGTDGDVSRLVSLLLSGAATGGTPVVRRGGTLMITAQSPFFGLTGGVPMDRALNMNASLANVKVVLVDTVTSQTYQYPVP
jgi:hypothetical protein